MSPPSDRPLIQKILYGLQALSFAVYLALLIVFSVDGAYVMVLLPIVGIAATIGGAYGVYAGSFPALMSYSVTLVIWMVLAVIHLLMIENLIRLKDTSAGRLLLGNALSVTITDENQAFTYQILYPVLYIVALIVTAVSTVLACMLPTPEGSGWKYPWLASKVAVDQSDDFYDDGNNPYFNPYGMAPPMFLGIPTYPIQAPPQFQNMHRQQMQMQRGPASRSMPNVYDPRGGQQALPPQQRYFEEDKRSSGYRVPRRSASQHQFDDRERDVPQPSPVRPRSNSRESRESSTRRPAGPSEFGQRRRSSAADNFGFL